MEGENKVVVSIQGQQAGHIVHPQAVLDTCLGHLQDISTKVESQDKKLRDHRMQVSILKDKMRLMEHASTLAA